MTQQSDFLGQTAALWHEVATVRERTKYADLTANSSPAQVHPGFFGRQYVPNGTHTLIIGMNRGGSGEATIDPAEKKALEEIRLHGSVDALQALNEAAQQLLPTWDLWGNNLLPLLARAGVPVASVAYVHGVPFRLTNNKFLRALYPLVWQRLVSRQLGLLRPARIIFAGVGVGEALTRFSPVKCRTVPRVKNDALPPEKLVDLSAVDPRGFKAQAHRVAEAHESLVADAAFWA